jgi:CRP-like cAMP-binding protein
VSLQYQLPIFENLCAGWLKITHLGIRRTFPKGLRVFDMDAPIDGVYLVVKGSVEVILHNLHGPEKVLFYVGPGCIFGEISCFVRGESDEAHVRFRSECTCYFFSRDTIEETIAMEHPELLIELIRAEAYKIRMYGVLLQDSLNSDNFLRVSKMLLYLVRFKGPDPAAGQKLVSIRPEMTQTDMARLMGIHRVTVTKAVNRLKQMNIIAHFSKTRLEILDFPGLCGLVEKEI